MSSHNDKTSVVDSDPRFIIDPITRTIQNTSDKSEIVQFDHNSERLTFECPRYIEGHDMLNCNKVIVNYLCGNLYGAYEVDDLKMKPSTTDTVLFSWLISSNATQKVGKVHFAITFECVQTTGEVTYKWNTKIIESIQVVEGMSYDNTIVYENIDILERWKTQLFGTNDSGFITKNEVYIGTVEPSVDEGYAVWINPEEDNGYIQQPSIDGESGQVLTYDGNGGTYWSSMSGSGGSGIETSLELVWTNPTQGTSSAQVFGAQTVNVDLSNYKAVMIEFVMTAGYSSRVCQIFMIGSTGRAITLSYNDTDVNLPTGTLCYDRIVKPTISGIQFLDCNVNATTVINKCLFPLRVYGIK